MAVAPRSTTALAFDADDAQRELAERMLVPRVCPRLEASSGIRNSRCRPIGIDHVAGLLRRTEADPFVEGHGCQHAHLPVDGARERDIPLTASHNILVVNDPTSFSYLIIA